jgi:hypothetical protein
MFIWTKIRNIFTFNSSRQRPEKSINEAVVDEKLAVSLKCVDFIWYWTEWRNSSTVFNVK